MLGNLKRTGARRKTEFSGKNEKLMELLALPKKKEE